MPGPLGCTSKPTRRPAGRCGILPRRTWGIKPVVEFELHQPVEVALHWPEGKIVASRFGERVMYSLDQPAGRVMFLDLAVAQQINMLKPSLPPGFCPASCGNRGRRRRRHRAGDEGQYT